jgi:hypothetical protein
MRPERGRVDVSVLVPVSERPTSLDELYREHAEVLEAGGRSFEFVFALEPWGENLTEPLADIIAGGGPVTILQAARTMGDTGLARLALGRCRGRIILALPAYGRVEPVAILKLIEGVDQGSDLTVARRWPRRDPWINRMQTWVLHALLARATDNKLHDVGSGVWAGRREVLQQIPLYGDFFRFLPMLAIREGFRVEEVDCRQHTADRRTRVYRPTIYLRRMLDVLALYFLTRFTHKPLRFFGLLGSMTAVAGCGILVVVAVQRLAGQPLANRPVLLLGVLLITLGVQAVALGLIGEIVVHLHESKGRRYRVLSDSAETSAAREE